MPRIDMKEAFARAYSEAVLAEANMRESVSALESIRERMSSKFGYLEVLDTIDEQIGQADLTRLVPALGALRTAYSRAVVEMESERLKQEFSRGPSAGWQEWLRTYAQLFRETTWRSNLGHELASHALVDSPSAGWPVERVQRCTWLVWRERWPESYDWFLFLAQQDIPVEYRARLLAIAATIQIYHFSQPTKAEKLLQQAEELAPGEHLTSCGWAELWLRLKATDRAKKRYQEIVDRKPRLADGYVGLADCCDQEGDALAAEAFYQQAVQFAPGMTSSHKNLMNWYARRINESEGLIVPIFRRLNAVSDDVPGDCVSLGVLYREAEKYGRAREWLTKAVEMQPDNGLAEIFLGYVDCDEAATDSNVAPARLASAVAHFQKDLQICPEAHDGYLGMSDMFMQRKEWETAREWCERSFQCHPEWETSNLVRRASIWIKLKNWTAAEGDLRRSLERESENPAALDVLLDLTEELGSSGDQKRAEALLGDWRRHKGHSGEHLYQNVLGNWCYTAGDYPGAEQHYKRAVTANPKNAVLHSNHALAAEKLRTQAAWRDWLAVAIEELSQAARLDAKEPEYRERLTRLMGERDFIETYGEKALELVPVVTPVRVDVPNEMLPAILDGDLRALSKDTLDRIDDWRRGFRARLGVPLPGIKFNVLDEESGRGKFQILVMERELRWANANDTPLLDAILQQIETVCVEHVSEFLGHQETADLLRELEQPEVLEIVETPAALTGFVAELRGLLTRRMSVADLGPIAREYLERYRARVASSAIVERLGAKLPPRGPTTVTFPSLVLRGSMTPNDTEQLRRHEDAVRQGVFLDRGVIVPMIEYQKDEAADREGLELLLDGRPIGSHRWASDLGFFPAFLIADIESHAAEFVVPQLIERYLQQLLEALPDLVRVARESFTVDDLTSLLRRRVESGYPIRDLRGVLEEILQAWA